MSRDRPYRVPEWVPALRVRGIQGKRIKAPHWPFKPLLLDYVEREMASRGHCLVRAVRAWDDGDWLAIEGSHRLWIAHTLGVTVDVQPVERDYRVQHDNPELGIVTAARLVDVGENIRGPAAWYELEVRG